MRSCLVIGLEIVFFQLLMQARLEFREALEAELLHHAHHGRRGHPGGFRHGGDRAEARHGIIVQQAVRQLLFGAVMAS